MSDESNPYRPKAFTRRDVLHDQQLLRDLALINARMLQELGPLPTSGLPVDAKRRPVLPQLPLPSARTEIQEDDAMKFSPIVVAASLALTACAPPNESPNAQRNDPTAETRETDSPSLRHKFRVNPSPRQRYDITMTIKDAPGPFGMVKFWAHYLAPDCMYWTDKFAGTTGKPTHTIEMPFQKLNDTTYVGTVYLDGMVDDNYYGDGLCHWQLTEVAVGLKATGADTETGFAPDISPETILAQRDETRFMWREYYPRAGIDNFAEFGDKTLDKVPMERHDEFFTIVLASKEVQP